MADSGLSGVPITQPVPLVIFTLGLYRSASTWVANVAAELLRLRAPATILYVETAEQLAAHIDPAQQTITKSHHPDPALRLLMQLSGAPLVVAVREPLDCVVSYIQAFGAPFERAMPFVAASATVALDVLSSRAALVIRYEETEGRNASMVQRIARCIGIDAPDADAQRIADKLSAASVDAFIADLVAADYFGSDLTPARQFHAETHWHPGHIGPGTSGRYAAHLTPEQIETVATVTRPFREALGYASLPADAPRR